MKFKLRNCHTHVLRHPSSFLRQRTHDSWELPCRWQIFLIVGVWATCAVRRTVSFLYLHPRSPPLHQLSSFWQAEILWHWASKSEEMKRKKKLNILICLQMDTILRQILQFVGAARGATLNQFVHIMYINVWINKKVAPPSSQPHTVAPPRCASLRVSSLH